jgi:hypothetical protein
VHLAQEIMVKAIHTQAMRYQVWVDLDHSIGWLNGNQPKSAQRNGIFGCSVMRVMQGPISSSVKWTFSK